MWSGDDDLNEDGKPVRLYMPIILHRNKPFHLTSSSFVGGTSVSAVSSIPTCATCRENLYLLVQLYVPEVQRTFQVFCCNQLSCVQGLFPTNNGSDKQQDSRDMLCYGGGGVVVCRRLGAAEETKQEETKSAVPDEKLASTSDWVDAAPSHDNEWATIDQGDGGLDDELEAKLAAMETSQNKAPDTKPFIKPKTTQAAVASSTDSSAGTVASSFPCFELHSQQEPPAVRRANVDADDVGMGRTGSKDDAKIQQMLAKYMEEEEDEDVLAMLRGEIVGGGTGGKSGERDEKLSATDRAMLTFTDRLKRVPRQVLRYARGGEPLWSIPVISLEKQVEEQDRRQSRKPAKQQLKLKMHGVEKPIPPCSECGAARVFEFQIVPTLLHVLEVDKYVATDANGDENSGKISVLDSKYQQGGMDWGNIVVYSCSNPICKCAAPVEEYCVVQDSIDERPTGPKRQIQTDTAVIQEDAKFDGNDDDDDDEEDGGEDIWEGADDDDDDDESW